jgi:hypothetical protein
VTSSAVALTCHPATPCETVRRIVVQALRTTPDTLELRYVLQGEIARLLIPAEATARRADKLWQHTCFEAFVAAMEATGYHELNFSPSTEWAICRFTSYREEMTSVDAEHPPRISVHRDADRLSLEAVIDLEPLRNSAGLRLALSAVVEDERHSLSYWALAHPPGKPDFHHAAGFALTLPPLISSPSGRGRG